MTSPTDKAIHQKELFIRRYRVKNWFRSLLLERLDKQLGIKS